MAGVAQAGHCLVTAAVDTRDGREIVLWRNNTQLHHLDQAYSSAVHGTQGITCDRAVAVLGSNRGPGKLLA